MQHRTCVGLPARGILSPTWRCPECKKGEVRDNRDDAPVRGRSSAITDDFIQRGQPSSSPTSHTSQREQSAKTDITNEDLMEELKAMRFDLVNFRKEISGLKVEIQTCINRIDGLESRIDALEKCTVVQNAGPGDFNKVINQLKSDLNDRDQDLLANDLEVRNIPEEKGENPTHLIISVAAKLGLNLENRDIVIAERIGGRFYNATNSEGPTEARSRAIVVRMARRDLRDELLHNARVRRSADTSDIGVAGRPVRFYINERLTKINRQLFRLARDAGRRNGWQFVWTRRGRILARRKPGDAVVRIRDENDVFNNIGPVTNTI
ncbi:hypothetical protein K1T71_015018 [Dendrolimus kikuchii]|nr:hypothetical protein K1T71_015018 [Dendrolimus kikuchii]